MMGCFTPSKGAVNSLTIGLSQEVAGEGIRINTVAPGLTATDMPPPEKLETQGPGIPIGRVAEASEIAEAIVWLLSDKASYTAGANIRVGGRSNLACPTARYTISPDSSPISPSCSS